MDLWPSPPDAAEQGSVLDGSVERPLSSTLTVETLTDRCVLRVDDSERRATLLVERKTYADFAISIADGRLFPQAGALARSPHRPAILLEGPRPEQMPDVHPHALQGAVASLAVMWRLPVLVARDPDDSLRILRALAHQINKPHREVLRRYDRKPKRVSSKKLYILQGLPGVGPALAERLLSQFGSIEHVIAADETALSQVRGIGHAKATRIKDLVR